MIMNEIVELLKIIAIGTTISGIYFALKLIGIIYTAFKGHK